MPIGEILDIWKLIVTFGQLGYVFISYGYYREIFIAYEEINKNIEGGVKLGQKGSTASREEHAPCMQPSDSQECQPH